MNYIFIYFGIIFISIVLCVVYVVYDFVKLGSDVQALKTKYKIKNRG